MEQKLTFKSCTASALGQTVLLFDALPSTNDYVKQNRSQLPSGTVVLTLNQLAGHGRISRTWESASGEALAMTVLFKEMIPIPLYPLLPHCTGIAVYNALSSLTDGDFGIKWPNDILLNEKKICGILCESVIQQGCNCTWSGIGINLHQSKTFFEEKQLPLAASLLSEGITPPDPLVLAEKIVNQLELVINTLLKNGFAPLKREYSQRCITLSKEVKIIEKGEIRIGTALSVDDNGNLLVDFHDGRITPVFYGEASVRGIDV